MPVFNAKLTISVANNEQLDVRFPLVWTDDAGVKQPYDLTGRTFFAQARKTAKDTAVLLTMNVAPFGPPEDGILNFTAPLAEIEELKPLQNGVYDVLMSTDGGEADNVWGAPFIVTQGVSRWPTP